MNRKARSISTARFAAALLIGVAGIAFVWADDGAQAPARSPMAKVLADIKARDKGQLAVSEEDGRFLRVLVATRGAKRALEIGGASGYSAIWIGSGLKETGGRLGFITPMTRSSTNWTGRKSWRRTSAAREWPM